MTTWYDETLTALNGETSQHSMKLKKLSYLAVVGLALGLSEKGF